MKATRVLVLGLMLGLCGVACESADKGSDEKSSEKNDDDDGDSDKKKGKKKKKGDKKDKKKGDKDGDDKPASDKPEASATAEPAPAPAPAPPAKTCGGPKDIPDIPADKSDAPKDLEEWKAGCQVNTVGPNSEAPDCTVTVLREWLKVTCTGDMKGYELMDGFGNEGADYFKAFTPDNLLSFVIRMRKGASQKVRMCRAKERASLFVSWPPGKDKPTIIALQRGPKCDKSAWGG